LDFRKYGRVIFNQLPDTYGRSIVTNLLVLFLLVILAKIRRIRGVEVVLLQLRLYNGHEENMMEFHDGEGKDRSDQAH
jgi:hypothetical protein